MILVMSLACLASALFEGRIASMIYLDHSATTAVDPRVVAVMTPLWSELYGNPSSIYGLGRKAAAALEGARSRVAALLNCQPGEIVFTGGGTESDNLALRGVGLAQASRGRRHIITTPIEHHAVLHTAADLAEHFDFDVTPARRSVSHRRRTSGWPSIPGREFSQRGLAGAFGAQILWTQGCGTAVHPAWRQAGTRADGRQPGTRPAIWDGERAIHRGHGLRPGAGSG
jgi:hypothetical protein